MRRRLPRTAACASLALVGIWPTARAEELPPAAPVGQRATLFSWGEVPPSQDPQTLAAGLPEQAVFQSLLHGQESVGEDFWIRDKKWAGVFKMNDLPGQPAFAELLDTVTRAHHDGPEPVMEWATAPESIAALAGLSLGGVLLLRYTGMRRRTGLYFHDCGSVGGLSLCGIDLRPRGSAKRKPA